MKIKIKLEEKIFFTQNLEVMLRAGLSISTAMGTLSQQTDNKRFRGVLAQVREDIEKGTSLSSCLSKYPSIWNELFINMVRAGEISGKLEAILGNITIQLKKDYELKSRVKNAMIYPVIVLVSMTGIGIAMLVFVIPKISSVFFELSASLPLPTRMLIAFSGSMLKYGSILLTVFALLILSFIAALKNRKTRLFLHRIYLILPICGKIIKKINLARFTRVLSSLLKTDVPIAQSFDVTANTLGNALYKKAVSEITPYIIKGAKVGVTMQKYPKLFPPLVIQMVAVGEETGTLSQLIEELAVFYEEEVENTMKRLPTIIEPLLMIILGLGVGGMAISIILPMYNLAQNI